MNRHAQLMAWGEDDYGVIDHGRSVGRICNDAHSDARWCWSINTSPYPAPPPHNGVSKTFDPAKQEFKNRHEEMKRMGVRPFA
jgi:hypothetical protein